jgi:hypothetical protein
MTVRLRWNGVRGFDVESDLTSAATTPFYNSPFQRAGRHYYRTRTLRGTGMGILDFLSKQFVDVIDWVEEPGLLAWRYPMQDREIQNGACSAPASIRWRHRRCRC